MIGSSSYNHGRQLYPLYSASKAALFNLWQGSKERLADTDICVDLINPVRVLTRMSSVGKAIDPALDYLKPEQVAQQIILLCQEGLASRCIDLTFEDVK